MDSRGFAPPRPSNRRKRVARLMHRAGRCIASRAVNEEHESPQGLHFQDVSP